MTKFESRHPIDQIVDEARVAGASNGWLSCADTSARHVIQALTSWGYAARAGEGTHAQERHAKGALHHLHTAAVYALAAYINAVETLPTKQEQGDE